MFKNISKFKFSKLHLLIILAVIVVLIIALISACYLTDYPIPFISSPTYEVQDITLKGRITEIKENSFGLKGTITNPFNLANEETANYTILLAADVVLSDRPSSHPEAKFFTPQELEPGQEVVVFGLTDQRSQKKIHAQSILVSEINVKVSGTIQEIKETTILMANCQLDGAFETIYPETFTVLTNQETSYTFIDLASALAKIDNDFTTQSDNANVQKAPTKEISFTDLRVGNQIIAYPTSNLDPETTQFTAKSIEVYNFPAPPENPTE